MLIFCRMQDLLKHPLVPLSFRTDIVLGIFVIARLGVLYAIESNWSLLKGLGGRIEA